MMSTYLLALGFLTPSFAYAGKLITQELGDPLIRFHEIYRNEKMNKGAAMSRKYSDSGALRDINLLSVKSDRNFKLFNLKISRTRLIFWWIFCVLILIMTQSFSGIVLIFSITGLAIVLIRQEEIATRKAREKRIALELPLIVELFAILVSSGESPIAAIFHLARISQGEIAHLLGDSVANLQSGMGLVASLDNFSRSGRIPELRRFCDSLIIAVQRGTSLAEVLSRQVVEIRANHHAKMIEAAGKAEIALMIPVVFLVLPISVLFALWPSFVALGQSTGF